MEIATSEADFFDEEINFGVDNVEQFNNRFSVFSDISADEFVRIYHHGDAVKISVSAYGGIIITKDNKAYLFVNGNSDYRTPTLFGDGFIDGFVYDRDTIYLLRENGDFGYIKMVSPEEFIITAENITKFQLQQIETVSEGVPEKIFLLSKDHQLYVVDKEQTVTGDMNFIPNVVDFDVCNNSKAAYLTTEGTLWYSEQYHADMTVDYLAENAKMQEFHQEDLKMFALYNGGMVLLYDNGNVFVRGYNFHYDIQRDLYHDELIATECQSIFTDQYSIGLIDSNGKLIYYGTTPNSMNSLLFD